MSINTTLKYLTDHQAALAAGLKRTDELLDKVRETREGNLELMRNLDQQELELKTARKDLERDLAGIGRDIDALTKKRDENRAKSRLRNSESKPESKPEQVDTPAEEIVARLDEAENRNPGVIDG